MMMAGWEGRGRGKREEEGEEKGGGNDNGDAGMLVLIAETANAASFRTM